MNAESNAGLQLNEHEQRLLRDCYEALQELAELCAIPAVRAASRSALAQVHTALDGQAMDFEMYTHSWLEQEAG